MLKAKPKILVLGAGFGGLYTAKYLAESLGEKVEITVVDARNYFLFTPLLHEVAAATVNDKVVVEYFPSLLNYKNLVTRVAKVKKIWFEGKKVDFEEGFSLDYDYLVVALGSEVQTFGISGVNENAFFLKNLEQAIAIKNKLVKSLQDLNLAQVADLNQVFRINIVGAGPTGLELAGEISDFLDEVLDKYFVGLSKEKFELNLINSGDSLLPQQNPKLGKWIEEYLKKIGWNLVSNSRVTKVEIDKIVFADGSEKLSDLTVWAAGVKPVFVESDINLLSENKRFKVNDFLQTERDEVFALGDIADGFPMLAQVASQQAKVVAFNLKMQILGRSERKEFKFMNKGFLVSVGKWNAVGEVFGFTMKGPLVWILWHAVYFFKFISNSKKARVLLDWLLNVFKSRDITTY